MASCLQWKGVHERPPNSYDIELVLAHSSCLMAPPERIFKAVLSPGSFQYGFIV